MLRREARLQKALDRVASAQRLGHAHEPRDDRADGERQQRERHGRRRLVRTDPGPVAMRGDGAVRLGRAVGHFVIVFVRAAVRVRIGGMRCAMTRRQADVARARHFPCRAAIPAGESHRHQPEHIERRHERGHDRDRPDGLVREKRAEEDLVLAEES